MWFKNLKIYRLNPNWHITAEALSEALQPHAFNPGNPGRDTQFGWVPVMADADLVYGLQNVLFLSLKAEKKLLPASVINQFAREKAKEVEEQQGYRPGRKQLKEIKELVTDTLLPKAFSIYRETRLYLDLEHHYLVIDAASPTKADEVISQLVKVLNPMPIQSYMTAISPSTAMTEWLYTDQAPAGFSIDPHTEFKSTQQERATIRFANITPEQSEVAKHVESGKICSKLGLTWQDRVSFVLDDTLTLKKITPLELLSEEKELGSFDETEQFDADMTLMSRTLAQLLQDLTEALGGLKPVN
ncbi:recombination-associated protein RdgC [Brackiella oedipodis]|uniref:recombination-associated protein RdgC n=1 Tax=Brackiella oedipodis TaxID=124225 RepID=UPI00048FC58C|nr:recombination-associated protein RdgC [Brackiella oedipodis]